MDLTAHLLRVLFFENGQDEPDPRRTTALEDTA